MDKVCHRSWPFSSLFYNFDISFYSKKMMKKNGFLETRNEKWEILRKVVIFQKRGFKVQTVKLCPNQHRRLIEILVVYVNFLLRHSEKIAEIKSRGWTERSVEEAIYVRARTSLPVTDDFYAALTVLDVTAVIELKQRKSLRLNDVSPWSFLDGILIKHTTTLSLSLSKLPK